MNRRSKEFFEKRKQVQLQQAWDKVSDFMMETSIGSHTHFAGVVENGHYGHMVLHTSDEPAKLVSTKNYRKHRNY